MKKFSSLIAILIFLVFYTVACEVDTTKEVPEKATVTVTSDNGNTGDIVIDDPIIDDPEEPPIIIDPEDLIVVILPASIVSDVDFYYVTNTKTFYYFKNKTLNTLSFSVTVDGVSQSFTPTEFFSIIESGQKVLYFSLSLTIDSVVYNKNFKQVSNVITEITTLPTKPVKSNLVYGTKMSSITAFYYDDSNSRICRKMTGGWDDAIKARKIDSCAVINHSIYSNGIAFNVVDNANGTANFPTKGLYFYADNYTLYMNPMKLADEGQMW